MTLHQKLSGDSLGSNTKSYFWCVYLVVTFVILVFLNKMF